MPTYEECIAKAGALLAEGDLIDATKPPRQLAEEAYNPTYPAVTVDVLEDRIRVQRGLPPIHVDQAS